MDTNLSSAPTSPAAVELGQPDDLLTNVGLKASLGGVSEMTVWRWTREKGFPPPDLVINRRKFWKRATVQAWIASQSAKSDAPKAAEHDVELAGAS